MRLHKPDRVHHIMSEGKLVRTGGEYSICKWIKFIGMYM